MAKDGNLILRNIKTHWFDLAKKFLLVVILLTLLRSQLRL